MRSKKLNTGSAKDVEPCILLRFISIYNELKKTSKMSEINIYCGRICAMNMVHLMAHSWTDYFILYGER